MCVCVCVCTCLIAAAAAAVSWHVAACSACIYPPEIHSYTCYCWYRAPCLTAAQRPLSKSPHLPACLGYLPAAAAYLAAVPGRPAGKQSAVRPHRVNVAVP